MQGWQVVLEDYVGGSLRAFAIGIARLAHVAAALVLGFAVVRLAMGAGA
jgi:succinate dehydrogenase hydrophobic anchor subunit